MPLPLSRADDVAKFLVDQVQSVCQRIEITGALRRRMMPIHKLEFLVLPSILHDESQSLFAEFAPPVNMFLQRLDELEKSGLITKRASAGGQYCWGSNLRKVCFGDIAVDFHSINDPAQWGYKMAILTGPEDYSQLLVTQKIKAGLMPNNLTAEDGYVWEFANKTPLETFEEEDFFALLGLPLVDPQERGKGRAVRPCHRVSA